MYLVRLVVVESHALVREWERWSDERDGVEIAAISSAVSGLDVPLGALALAARAPLESLPQLDNEGRVLVPSPERCRCEVALEDAASFISTVNHGARVIRSPLPYVAFVPQSDNEREFLEGSKGILAGMRTIRTPSCRVPLSEARPEWFKDRLLGVSLLSDAIASRVPVGKYRDLVRLFEHAFRLSSTKISKRLAGFLDFRNRGYSRSEVEAWMRPRNPLSHGDEQDEFPHEADVRLLLPRMEEAAIDVLFNKAVWRDSSTARRTAWHPPLWTESRDMSRLVGIRGREWQIVSQLLDSFGRYLMDRKTEFATISPDWWTTRAPDESEGWEQIPEREAAISFLTDRGTLRVIEAEDVEDEAQRRASIRR